MKLISGDIALIDLGDSPFGHEQAGLRPAIVLSIANGIALIVPLTSNTASLRFSGALPIAPSKGNGLSTTSVALAFHIRAVDARRMIRRVGALDTKDRRVLNKLIRAITTIS